VLVSNAYLVKEIKVSPSFISDHELILVVLNMKRTRPKPTHILARSYKNYKPDAFLHDLSQVPWHIIGTFEDVNDSLYAFHQLFEQILDQHAPIRKVKIRSHPNPFITPEIRELMKTRDSRKDLTIPLPGRDSGIINEKSNVKSD